jgi:hypothetical protein
MVTFGWQSKQAMHLAKSLLLQILLPLHRLAEMAATTTITKPTAVQAYTILDLATAKSLDPESPQV